MRHVLAFLLIGLSITSSATAKDTHQYVGDVGDGFLEVVNGLPVLHLKGSRSEMGYQYGYLVGDRIKGLLDILPGFAGKETEWLPSWAFGFAQRLIGWAFWTQFSEDDKQFLLGIQKGAKDGQRIKLKKYDLAFLNSLIDVGAIVRESLEGNRRFESRTRILKALGLHWLSANCDSFAAWGSRTVGGKTFQTRNVDLDVGTGLERFPLVVVFKPNGATPYVSAGFAGQAGVFTGLNAHGVGLGQIWAFSKIKKLGTPWQLQMNQVMGTATSAPEAIDLFGSLGNRTYGSNFVFADAGGNGRAAETTPKHFSVFTENDPKEDQARWNGELYAIPLKEAVFRGDVAMDPEIRAKQTASNGPSGDPRTAKAYRERYQGQGERIVAYEHAGVLIGKDQAEAISRETAMRKRSLQTAVYANTDRELWVSYAEFQEDGSVRQAYAGEYKHIPFASYLPTLELRPGPSGAEIFVRDWMNRPSEFELELTLVRNGHLLRAQLVGAGSETKTLASLGAEEGDVIELRHSGTGVIADRTVVRKQHP